ncbi:transglutaminase family protein [Sphingomonas sp. XXL09]|uniref:transglutaminase family protein n=1 Tax=Sphingomonas sp. XXL09 TaxID=3457787 RepID=UPI00406BDAB5
MRLSIDHRTVYRFSAPQTRIVQMLRLTPENSHDQTVARWRIDVDCDARMRRSRDGFGNAVTMLYADGPIDSLEIAVRGEVLTSHASGVVRGVADVLPPALFLRTTETTAADAALAAFAREARGSDGQLGALHRFNRALHARFAPDCGRPQPGLTAAAAFARPSATTRDMAQMFLAGARALGAPARYVSGYSLADGAHRPTPHGWAEVHVDGLGWIAFDPSAGRSPEEEVVRVAIALDAAGAAPVAGSRLGEGEEELAVDVTVREQ